MDFIWALAISSHLSLQGEYNNIHPHIRIDNNEWVAGAYYNSERNLSAYGGYRLELDHASAIELGIVTGYSAFGSIAPYARATYDIENFRIFVAPALEKYNQQTNKGLVIGLEFLFNK